MKKKIFIAAAVLISNQLLAQQDSTKNLNEVFISANKFPNKTSLTGKVVVLITRDQLDKSGGSDLSQVLSEQAGMYVNGANSNPGKDKSVYLRGAKVDHTLITVDGVPLYDPSGIGSNFDIRLLPIDNIERIEILKGSQSTLYGSDAIAGVINIITRKDSKKPVNIDGMLSYGTHNTLHASTALRGMKDKFDYSVYYSYHKTNGINEATDTITTAHEADKDGFDQNSLYASVGFRPVSTATIRPYIRYSKIRGKLDNGAFTDELDYDYTSDDLQAGVKNEFLIGKAKLNVLYNYNSTKREYVDDSVKSRNGFDIYSKGNYTGREHYAEAYIVMPVKTAVTLTAGMDYRSSNTDQQYHSVSVYGPYDPLPLSKDSLKQNQMGVYAAAVLNARNGFNAELGGRFNHHSTYGSNFVFNVNPSFLLKEQWKFFVNISSAYKTPTLYQLYSEFGNKTLDPEKAIGIEGGVQFFAKKNKAVARATYFNRAVRDVIFFYTDPNTFQSVYINQDKQNDHGIELETTIRFCKSGVIKMFYTWTDGRVTTRSNGKDTTYFNLIRRPKNTLGLTIGGNIGKRLYAGTTVNAIGKRADITYDAFFNQVGIKLDPYILWGAYAQYSFLKNKIKVFADLHNITGTKYTEVYGFNTQGFNATGGVHFNF